ncbi:WLM-domain-containing protein [Patellaria atrata CBS 101060]|uniref:WLM-domain-containing protein n=1 Tax=Patellaria atrata CBS 101060 TaxID=1346257 RepID=A0A9P4VR71_9PEZI|nr:WLM-domain-containing protein [Patellaria atrata CBS 101060]
MPLGFERINERTQRPNALINFIKPLPGIDHDLALDFLNRVAAIVYPVMKRNHIAVMALEEFPANREFVGRNFNAGEVVQLVLKAPGGAWLPFKHVQMVMMHELAHCKQMNHSGAFWKIRDAYAAELRELWERRYIGEGMWGRGTSLLSGRYETETMPAAGGEVKQLCGGTYRSGRGKRKRKAEKEKMSYAERQQRRILKKFGAGGSALGADEEIKAKLENGKKSKGKPRVAGSARGRELRAAAALARFDQAKKVEVKVEDRSESESDSDYDEGSSQIADIDIDGKRMTDGKGRGLVKVCEGEDDDTNAHREMDEIYSFNYIHHEDPPSLQSKPKKLMDLDEDQTTDASESSRPASTRRLSRNKSSNAPISHTRPRSAMTKSAKSRRMASHDNITQDKTAQFPGSKPPISNDICPVCSLVNDPDTVLCAACSNVLNPAKMPNNWRCKSLACQGGSYINAGDYGRCGLCGASRPPNHAHPKSNMFSKVT